MNALELIAALKGADEETAMKLVERLQCGEIDCSVLPTGNENAVQQAQIWAQEARTQKGIVEEIGKLVGCSNDWEMVSAVKAALSANGGKAWGYCPECGSQEFEHGSLAHKFCKECGQEWFSDIDYTDVVRRNLAKAHPAPPSVAVPDVTTAEGLIGIVEGIQGTEHGTWTDDNGVRLKDTGEWARFYLSVRNNKAQQSFDPEKLASALREIEGTVNRTATSDQFIRHLKKIATDALTAAPTPDHTGDANKMADDLPGMRDQSDLSGGETDVRPPKHHTLKTDPAVYDRSAMGRKPWEIRLNDRDYQVGDTVTLQETKYSGEEMQQGAPLEFTGNEITGQITYVLRGPKYGLAEGWCIFSVEPSHIADAGKVVASNWKTAKHGQHWPHIGGKYLIKLNGVLQHEIYEFDQGDDGMGGGEYFWDREDLDEAAPFDHENDEWLPIDEAGMTAPSVPEEEVYARVLEEAALRASSEAVEIETRFDDGQDIVEGAMLIEEHIAEWLRKEAARLRTAGDDGEEETHG